ncbi:LpqB family beta-propeller domain-containing protein [Pengzhenrongella sicca]|uniref:GerMN domain-containing protein n=1 Tax=Pengzhenrongella sicca TaxID=2819238 RepID=A0A8A4ZE86_9MICO|nr:LpqB family beta-propeller domain-containing protein [Pengzhenrongella sicca]QTE30282.1 GerMN domain-containing protein [Pengzhenrongella sicca]
MSSARALRRAAVAVMVAATLLLAGCIGLPTSGPVGEGDGAVDAPGPVFPLAYSPDVGADAQAIVQGFLAASAAGLSDNYAVARQYLAGAAQATWQPSDGVVVYSTASGLDLAQVTETQISVTLPVVATLDADGRYAEGAPGAQQDAVFEMLRNADGQWRISGLSDGVMLSEPIFSTVYRATSLYFLTPARDLLVPEVRWFPQRNTPTYAVRALLSGPTPWLLDAVTTAFPAGTRLAVESVPVDADGVATVDLTAAVAGASSADRALLKAQLEHVLEPVGVRSVNVSIGGLLMADPLAADLPSDPAPTGGLEALSGGRLQRLSGSAFEPVETVGPLDGLDARSPAAGVDGDPQVLLSGPDRLVLAPTATAAAQTLLTGTALLAPSVDELGWIWSGPAAAAGSLQVVRADGTTVVVGAGWLEDRTVRSIRVSRDGTRIAVVSTGPDGPTVDVAGVVRDSSGAPQRLGDQLRVGARLTNATQVDWVDESTLAVLGTSGTMTGPTMHLVPIAGRTRALPALEGANAIATGKGERALYLGSDDGSLFTLQGTSWREVATGVTSPTYSR